MGKGESRRLTARVEEMTAITKGRKGTKTGRVKRDKIHMGGRVKIQPGVTN